jgi:streptogramin lyase
MPSMQPERHGHREVHTHRAPLERGGAVPPLLDRMNRRSVEDRVYRLYDANVLDEAGAGDHGFEKDRPFQMQAASGFGVDRVDTQNEHGRVDVAARDPNPGGAGPVPGSVRDAVSRAARDARVSVAGAVAGISAVGLWSVAAVRAVHRGSLRAIRRCFGVERGRVGSSGGERQARLLVGVRARRGRAGGGFVAVSLERRRSEVEELDPDGRLGGFLESPDPGAQDQGSRRAVKGDREAERDPEPAARPRGRTRRIEHGLEHEQYSLRLRTRPRGSVPALLLALAAPVLAAQTITEFPLSPRSSPAGIAAGPDGNVWFIEEHGDKVGRIAPSGAIAEFPLANARAFGRGVTAGPDGALWFTELTGRIGRVTPAGVVTELAISTRPAEPIEIAAGPDGNLWFTDFYDRIGRVTPGGVFTNFALPSGVGPRGIAPGPDGALWFAETNVGRIGRISVAGTYTEFPLPDAGCGPFGIAVGRDGNIWFTEIGASRIGRMTPAGAIAEFSLAGGAQPFGIAAGSDGALWFTESALGRIGRITTAGAVTELPIPTSGGGPTEIASGPDGNIWFTEFSGDRIGRVAIQSLCTPDATTLCLNGARFQVRVTWNAPSGTSGNGQTIALTGDTGAFWFFSANNIEIVVKVVDGRSFNGYYWVFVGSLSNVHYEVTVRDLATDQVNAYVHEQGILQSLSDTAAFHVP